MALFTAAFTALAATPSHGPDALRSLAFGPLVNASIGYGVKVRDGLLAFTELKDRSGDIRSLQSTLQQQPGDVSTMIVLAEMLDETDATNSARIEWQAAEKLCRNHIETAPADGSFLMRLGVALDGLGQTQQAESDFRHATSVSSNDWHCWAALAVHLQGCVDATLSAPLAGICHPSPNSVPKELLDYHPLPEALQQSETMSREAGRCLARAVALAPREPEAWVNLGWFACCSNWDSRLIAHYKGEDHTQLDSSGWASAFLCPGGLADFKQAEVLDRTNSALIAGAGMFTIMAQLHRDPNSTPESLQQTVRDEIRLLQNLALQPDKQMAAGALTALAVVQATAGDASGARASARQAISADPSLDSAWEFLLGISIDSDSPSELVDLCQSRLKQVDTIRNRLFLAKAFLRGQKPGKAAEQAQIILQSEPHNLDACVALIVADLKQSDDPRFMQAAAQDLQRATDLVHALPADAVTFDRWKEISLNAAIWNGLQDGPEYQAAAKAWIQVVLHRVPDDQTAKNILHALQ